MVTIWPKNGAVRAGVPAMMKLPPKAPVPKVRVGIAVLLSFGVEIVAVLVVPVTLLGFTMRRTCTKPASLPAVPKMSCALSA